MAKRASFERQASGTIAYVSSMASMRVPPALVVRVIEKAARVLDRMRRAITPPPAEMMEMVVAGFLLGRCLNAVVELGLIEQLDEGPRTAGELARECGADADALRRVLRLLASHGVFAELGGDRFGPTRLSACLCSRDAASIREWVRLNDEQRVWPSWSAFGATIRNGRSIHENSHGTPFFAWLAQNPDLGKRFDDGMASFSRGVAPTVVAAYDFSRFARIIDVGGGQGALLAAILHAHPDALGTLFDRPEVVARARHAGPLTDSAIAARAEFAAGDVFDAVPAGCDAYVLKWVLHDWSDGACVRILGACRRAIAARAGTVVLVEMVLEERRPAPSKLAMDVAMMSLTGGRERTAREYGELLRAAGFALRRVVPTASPLSVLEARPV
jgi:hypothetical protein